MSSVSLTIDLVVGIYIYGWEDRDRESNYVLDNHRSLSFLNRREVSSDRYCARLPCAIGGGTVVGSHGRDPIGSHLRLKLRGSA